MQLPPLLNLTLMVYGKPWVFDVLVDRVGRPQGGGHRVLPWVEVTSANMRNLHLLCAQNMGKPPPSAGLVPRGSPRRRRVLRKPSDPIRSGRRSPSMPHQAVLSQPAALMDPTRSQPDTAMGTSSSSTQQLADREVMDSSSVRPDVTMSAPDRLLDALEDESDGE